MNIDINDKLLTKIREYFAEHFPTIDHTLTDADRVAYFIRSGFINLTIDVKAVYRSEPRYLQPIPGEQ